MNNTTRGNWYAAAWLVVIAFALIGQYYMSSVQISAGDTIWGIPRDGLLFYGVASALFIGLVASAERAGGEAGQGVDVRALFERARNWVADKPVRAALIAASLATIYTAMRTLMARSGAVSYWDIFAMWALAGLLYIAAFLPAPRARAAEVPALLRAWFAGQAARVREHRVEALVLIALMLVAAIVRFAALGAIPDVVSGDEGRIGSLGLSAANREIVNPFITTFGHSTMYLFMEGEMLTLFGTNTALGLRALHALAGLLTVLVTFLIGKEMFDTRVGLAAAALMALSHFHIHFSRIIVAGGIMDALMAAVAVYFFWRGLKRNSTLAFVLAGITVGLHLYFYMGGRLVILFLMAYVVALYLVKPRLAMPNSKNFLAFAGAFIVLGLPMYYWATTQPQEFMARMNQIGIYQSGWIQNQMAATGKSQVTILLEQFRDSMLVFNYYPAIGFYFARLPMLDYLTAVPFVLGMLYALWKVFDARFLLLHAWFWSAVIGGNVLLINSGQAAYRVLVLVPVVFLFAAVALAKLLELGERALAVDRRAIMALGGVFLLLIGYVNIQYYFGEYANACRYEDGATRLASKMATYLGTLDPQRYNAYLLTGATLPSAGIHPSWVFLSRRMPIIDVGAPVAGPLPVVDTAKGAVFLFVPQRYAEESVVESSYPGGTPSEFYDCGNLIGKAWTIAPPGNK